MPRTTFRYPFEARIHAAVIAATGDPADKVLLRMEADAAAARLFRGESAVSERQNCGASGRPFLYYDGFDAPEYAFLEWRGVGREMMEAWLGRSFGSGDFTPHGDQSGADDLRLRTFPSDWSVIL